jgi:hypothetical protein
VGRWGSNWWSQMNNKLDLDFGHDLIDNGTSDDYYTPPFVFEALGIEFDMDVCAPAGGVPWIPAKQSLTIIEDGLTTPWEGRVWCNPPYSDVTPWAKRMIAHGNGIALVQTAKSAWFNEMWSKADGALILMPNLKFVRGNGQSAPILMPAMLFAFGDASCSALNLSGLGFVR